jgi:hypothetical protein
MNQLPTDTSYTDYYRLSWDMVKPPITLAQSILAFLPVTIVVTVIGLVAALYLDSRQDQLEHGIVAVLVLLLYVAFLIIFNLSFYKIKQSLGPSLIKYSISSLGIKAEGKKPIPWSNVNLYQTNNQINQPANTQNTLIIPLRHGKLKLRFQNAKIRQQILHSLTHYLKINQAQLNK